MVTLEINELIIRGCMLYKECNKNCFRKAIVNNPKWFAPYLSEELVNAKNECEYFIIDTNSLNKQEELESLFNAV